MNLYKINQLAIEFRLDIGLEHDAPLDFFPVVTNKLRNLTIVFLEMDEKISGACFKVDSQQIMFINSKHSKGRQVFTAAHEIYHLIVSSLLFNIYFYSFLKMLYLYFHQHLLKMFFHHILKINTFLNYELS
jgi:hypothetical protein